MPQWIERPTMVPAAGDPPKRIEEFVGRVNSGDHHISVARMVSPPGWNEPPQRPEFEEITVVLEGAVHVEHDAGTTVVRAGQAIVVRPGERVRYATPDGAVYLAICLPAFSPETVHRETPA